ncbi:unnamed protein product [Closterium sp. Naga37s-1]|nr:unnamed protein product [Closterium sp. Naga37s-1]
MAAASLQSASLPALLNRVGELHEEVSDAIERSLQCDFFLSTGGIGAAAAAGAAAGAAADCASAGSSPSGPLVASRLSQQDTPTKNSSGSSGDKSNGDKSNGSGSNTSSPSSSYQRAYEKHVESARKAGQDEKIQSGQGSAEARMLIALRDALEMLEWHLDQLLQCEETLQEKLQVKQQKTQQQINHLRAPQRQGRRASAGKTGARGVNAAALAAAAAARAAAAEEAAAGSAEGGCEAEAEAATQWAQMVTELKMAARIVASQGRCHQGREAEVVARIQQLAEDVDLEPFPFPSALAPLPSAIAPFPSAQQHKLFSSSAFSPFPAAPLLALLPAHAPSPSSSPSSLLPQPLTPAQGPAAAPYSSAHPFSPSPSPFSASALSPSPSKEASMQLPPYYQHPEVAVMGGGAVAEGEDSDGDSPTSGQVGQNDWAVGRPPEHATGALGLGGGEGGEGVTAASANDFPAAPAPIDPSCAATADASLAAAAATVAADSSAAHATPDSIAAPAAPLVEPAHTSPSQLPSVQPPSDEPSSGLTSLAHPSSADSLPQSPPDSLPSPPVPPLEASRIHSRHPLPYQAVPNLAAEPDSQPDQQARNQPNQSWALQPINQVRALTRVATGGAKAIEVVVGRVARLSSFLLHPMTLSLGGLVGVSLGIAAATSARREKGGGHWGVVRRGVLGALPRPGAESAVVWREEERGRERESERKREEEKAREVEAWELDERLWAAEGDWGEGDGSFGLRGLDEEEGYGSIGEADEEEEEKESDEEEERREEEGGMWGTSGGSVEGVGKSEGEGVQERGGGLLAFLQGEMRRLKGQSDEAGLVGSGGSEEKGGRGGVAWGAGQAGAYAAAVLERLREEVRVREEELARVKARGEELERVRMRELQLLQGQWGEVGVVDAGEEGEVGGEKREEETREQGGEERDEEGGEERGEDGGEGKGEGKGERAGGGFGVHVDDPLLAAVLRDLSVRPVDSAHAAVAAAAAAGDDDVGITPLPRLNISKPKGEWDHQQEQQRRKKPQGGFEREWDGVSSLSKPGSDACVSAAGGAGVAGSGGDFRDCGSFLEAAQGWLEKVQEGRSQIDSQMLKAGGTLQKAGGTLHKAGAALLDAPRNTIHATGQALPNVIPSLLPCVARKYERLKRRGWVGVLRGGGSGEGREKERGGCTDEAQQARDSTAYSNAVQSSSFIVASHTEVHGVNLAPGAVMVPGVAAGGAGHGGGDGFWTDLKEKAQQLSTGRKRGRE